MWRLLVLIADSTNLIIHFDCRGSGLLLWFWGRSHLGVLSPCGAGVKPKNLAGAFTLRCHLTVPESCVAPARSHLADSTNLIIHHACRGSELLFLWLWGRSHLAVLSPCGAGSNLRTLLVLSPCGACHLTVPESCVAPARSHLAHSPSLIIPDACRGSGILLLCLWGRAHLAVLSPRGAGVKPKNIAAGATNRIQDPEDIFLGADTQTQAQRQYQKSASLAQCKFLIRCTKKGLM